MSTRLRYPRGYQFFDGNGAPLALGNLYYYIAGTTTQQNTYSDSAGTVSNPNPIVLDRSGRLQVDVHLDSTADYKEVLKTSSAIISPWPDDNIERATSIVVFTGDSGSGGTSGLVPAPAAGDALANKFLKADGTWTAAPGGGSPTNLSATETATTVSIASSTGSGATIPAATFTSAGVLDSARATKIDGLVTVATSGSYTDLSNRPTLGSAAALSVPVSGNATAAQVVTGGDTRLSDSRAPFTVSSIAALKAASTTAGLTFLTSESQPFFWTWDPLISADRTAADVAQADLIAPTPGSAGAWRRVQKSGRTDIKSAFRALAEQRNGGAVLLYKPRANTDQARYEHHVFTQCGLNSPEWIRWVFSNEANAGGPGTGSLRMCNATRALLYRSRSQVPPPLNTNTGVSNLDVNLAGASIYPYSAATKLGTWTTSSVSGLSLNQSSTIGSSVSYAAYGADMIAWRGYSTTNGAVAKVAITQNGNPIPSANWIVPDAGGGTRLVSQLLPGEDAGLSMIPLAKGLSPASSYVVTLTYDTSSGSGNTMRDGGVVCWNAGWQTRAGNYGAIHYLNSTTRHQCGPGERVIYRCEDCTRVDWTIHKESNRGIASFEIYDAYGNQITNLRTSSQDCYAIDPSLSSITVVSGLPPATYYLHVIVSGNKNASSTKINIDHVSTMAINEAVAGIPGVDAFNLLDAAPLATSAQIGTSDYIGFDATLETVMSMCKPTESSYAFVGGVHGSETLNTSSVVFQVDGVAVDFANAAQGTTWTGSTVSVNFSTIRNFVSDGSPAASVTYGNRITPAGYENSTGIALTAAVKVTSLYSFMLSFPNTMTGNSGIGGGFGNVSLQPAGPWSYPSGVETNSLPVCPDAVAVWNGDYVVVGWPLNCDAVAAVFAPFNLNDGKRTALIANNANASSAVARNKIYIQPFSNTSGNVIPSGMSWMTNCFWGVAKTRDFGRLIS
jgi:hypothetical protein